MTRWVDVAGVAIAWNAYGPIDAPGLVLSHSLGSDSSMWRPQIEALAREFRVVTVDSRGHGLSDAPKGPYTLEVLGRDVLAVADAAGLDRFHVCGLSLGGQIALWLGVNRSERLWSVTACNTAAQIGTPALWDERIAGVLAGGMDAMRASVMDRWFAPGFAAAHPDWFQEASEVFSTTAPDGYVGCCGALAVSDLRDEIGTIDLPTLVIGGALDLATPPSDLVWLHEQIRLSAITIFDGAAHLSNLDVPEAFTTRLLAFLAAAS